MSRSAEKTDMWRGFFCIFLWMSLSSCSKPRFQGLETDESYRQASLGSDGRMKEHFVLVGGKKIKLKMLIIMDVTESMFHHLRNFGRTHSDLFFFLSDYDWEVAFGTADNGDHENPFASHQQRWNDHASEVGRFGALMNLEDGNKILNAKVLSSKMRNPERIFHHTVSHVSGIDCRRPPYCQGVLEQPLRSLNSAIERASLDNTYLLPSEEEGVETAVVSVIATNDEERSEDRERATTALDVEQTVYRVLGPSVNFIAINILIKDTTCLGVERARARETHINQWGKPSRRQRRQRARTNGTNSQLVNIGTSIMELARRTGGRNISICNENYGPILKEVSEYIRDSLENSIVLKKEPVPGTVEMDFGEDPKLDFKRHGRRIVFEKFSGTVSVSISYHVQGEN